MAFFSQVAEAYARRMKEAPARFVRIDGRANATRCGSRSPVHSSAKDGWPSWRQPMPSRMTTGLAPWIQAQLGQLVLARPLRVAAAGPLGLGQYPLAMALASAWLCEAPVEEGACGTCGRLGYSIEVRTHADLFVLMPETVIGGWPRREKA